MITPNIIERMRPGQLLQHYLMASLCYYRWNQSPMLDTTFDRLCKRLHDAFDSFDHPHKKYVDIESLAAGTGYMLHEDNLPTMVVCAAQEYYAAVSTDSYADSIEPYLLPQRGITPRRVMRTPAVTTPAVAAPRRVMRKPAVAVPAPTTVPAAPGVRRVVRKVVRN